MGIAGAVAGIGAVVGAMGVAIKATFNWANELDSIGDVMDVTNEQAAAFGFIARKSGVDTGTFTKSVVIMSKGLVKADGSLDTTGKSLESWGINVKDANGNLKSQTALMDDVSKKYSTFATQQEKVNFLTEVFGKSGAELVDFFDVMASEGGMDAVTQKVKAFGLAIDPARYENFTRNLEEIKLIGTGLAVTFTENIMPALEGLLGWVGRFASADPAAQLGMLADPLKALFNLTDAFKQGVEDTDWAGLSQQIADKVNSIDWTLVGQYVRTGVTNVLQGIQTIVSEIDWQALQDATGTALAGLVAGLYGYPDWESLKGGFNLGLQSVFDSINGAITLENFGKSITEALQGIVDGLKGVWQGFLDFLAATKDQASLTPGRAVVGGTNSTGIGGNAGQASNLLVTSPGRNVQGGVHRASGGAVIAGQQYSVGELGPEQFTSSVNGRIDPMRRGGDAQNNSMDVNALATVLARVLAVEMKKGFSK
jgi:hypothetical protein